MSTSYFLFINKHVETTGTTKLIAFLNQKIAIDEITDNNSLKINKPTVLKWTTNT